MDKPDQQSLKNFQILQKLGEGSYSQVFKVLRLSDNQIYAMKKVKMGMLKEKEKENALNEVRILASFNDPYIIAYKEAFIDEDSQLLCIIMEFASDGDLQHIIQSAIKKNQMIQEQEIWKALYQLTRGLKKLHEKHIVHRDIKCANIFIADGVYKLGDLNVSKVAKQGLVHTQTGTPCNKKIQFIPLDYASPEIWDDKPYDMRSDIWSLGCVIYEMASLKPPFRATDMQGLYKKVQKGIFDSIPRGFSRDLGVILQTLIQVQPARRPTCLQILNNPFLIKHFDDKSIFEITSNQKKNELLATILLPRNLKSLKGQLPQSKYEKKEVNLSFDEDKYHLIEKDQLTTKNKVQRVQSAVPFIKSQNKNPQTEQRSPLPDNYNMYPSAPRHSLNEQKARHQTKQTEAESPHQQIRKQNSQEEVGRPGNGILKQAQKAQSQQNIITSQQPQKTSPVILGKQLTSVASAAVGETALRSSPKQKEAKKSIEEKAPLTLNPIKIIPSKLEDKKNSSLEQQRLKEDDSRQAYISVKKKQEESKTQETPQITSVKQTEQQIDDVPFQGLVVEGLQKLNPMSIQSILCQPVLNIEDSPFPVQAKVIRKKPVEEQKIQKQNSIIQGGDHVRSEQIQKGGKQGSIFEDLPKNQPIRAIHNNQLEQLKQPKKIDQIRSEPPKRIVSQTPKYPQQQKQTRSNRPESANIVNDDVLNLKEKYQHYYPVSQHQQIYLDKMKVNQSKAQQKIQEQFSAPNLRQISEKVERISSAQSKRISNINGNQGKYHS